MKAFFLCYILWFMGFTSSVLWLIFDSLIILIVSIVISSIAIGLIASYFKTYNIDIIKW